MRTTSFLDHLSQLEQTFTAKDIMSSPILLVEEGKENDRVIEEARQRNIEILGYRDSGNIVGVVRTNLLIQGRRPRDVYERLTEDMMVPASTSVVKTFLMLESRRFLLVNSHEGFVGIVTPQDLDKRPMRIVLFAAISELERLIIERIRDLFEDDYLRLKEVLGSDWSDVAKLYEQKRQSNNDISYFDCLNPHQILKIASNEGSLRELLGAKTHSDFEQWGFLPTFRAQVVHPTDSYNRVHAAKLVGRWRLIVRAVRSLEGK